MGRPPAKKKKFEFNFENYTDILDDLRNRINRTDKSHFDLNNTMAPSIIRDDYLNDEKYGGLKEPIKHRIAISLYQYLRQEYAQKLFTSD